MFGKLWLGQVPLILGPSSPGAGIPFVPIATPPFYGKWTRMNSAGQLIDSGTVGPFNTPTDAYNAAAKAALDHGAIQIGVDGYAQGVDSQGRPVT